ncbi:hypothetical protein J1G42_01250 [Cellulomonas sp. zg-ZUI222]|uniref:Uncharacterized protein n=1 Tax=Cellulomonas wangleii TaxID=2816956 RepID=A0ABX8D4M6_9CELL|nr:MULTISPECIES: hypothetical protein [Cellulomonas]MBO0898590.1 hypothetical protein [Cellulomonas sp. zg-ZUI22]MBO0919452.1 hypothetical protein [Cellulomonas wangleii]MBO0924408.1 hypothetical protein [Cellulomonas wangleii]QVI62405.1 hypothetical protein KG103_00100 [Cellulomonas wangleii]
MTHRPKIDVDTERLKGQAAGLGATLADGAKHGAARASDAAGQAKDWTTPKVEAFVAWLVPQVEHLYRESVKTAAPQVEKVAQKATPAIDTAHDKLVDELIPKLVAAMNEAAVKAGAQVGQAADVAATSAGKHSKKIAKAARKAAKEAAKAEHKRSGAKVFWVVAGLTGAGAALFAWLRSRSTTDPWAEPWEPADSLGSESLRARAQTAAGDLTDAVGDAADAVGEAAGTAVAKSRDAVGKAAEAVGHATEELGDKAKEARDAAQETARKATRRSTPKTPDGTTPDEGTTPAS